MTSITALLPAITEAGQIAQHYYRHGGRVGTRLKADRSVVTEADTAVEALLRQAIGDCFPGVNILGEEGGAVYDPQRPYTFVIDPIDGTRAYLAGSPDWAISAALVGAGRPIVAALYAPATDELFLSIVGRGATLNGAPIAASRGGQLAGARFSGAKHRLESLAAIEPRIETAPRVPSLALRLARVASGALDGTLAAPNSHDWDLAAADLLVHEADGVMTTLTGQLLTYNKPRPVHGALIAAGRARHAALLGIIRDRLAEFA